LHLQHINPSTSPNELNTTLTPHSMTHGDACFAYFNKIWGIPLHCWAFSNEMEIEGIKGLSQLPNSQRLIQFPRKAAPVAA